jgi:hypothetical protein
MPRGRLVSSLAARFRKRTRDRRWDPVAVSERDAASDSTALYVNAVGRAQIGDRETGVRVADHGVVVVADFGVATMISRIMWACDAPATASRIIDTTKIKYQSVPASAAPTCKPPKW